MPAKNAHKNKDAVKYALVPQSLEDREFEGKAVLVPEAQVRTQHRRNNRARPPLVLFAEDLPDEIQEEERMELGMVDNIKEGKIFEDEVEEEFDENFIRQMMTGEGVPGFENIDEEVDPELKFARMDLEAMRAKYPRHDQRGANEKQFDKLMQEFDMDEDIQEEDIRTHGAMTIENYGSALEQFVAENAGSTMLSDAPAKHKGFIQQLSILARNNDGFSSLDRQVLTVTDRRDREIEGFFTDAETMKKDMLDAMRKRMLDETTISVGAAVEEEIQLHLRPDGTLEKPTKEHIKKNLPQFVQDAMDAVERRTQREDCETVLTTMTSTFNLPNVISVDKIKKLKMPKPIEVRGYGRGKNSKKNNNNNNDDEEEDDDEEEEDVDDMGLGEEAAGMNMEEVLKQQRIALSTVPEDETKDEKKQRKALVKQMQREARQVKKQVKEEFGKTGKEQTATQMKSKRDKNTTTLSSVRGNMIA